MELEILTQTEVASFDIEANCTTILVADEVTYFYHQRQEINLNRLMCSWINYALFIIHIEWPKYLPVSCILHNDAPVNWVFIGPDNDLLAIWCKAILYCFADLLWNNLWETFYAIQIFHFKIYFHKFLWFCNQFGKGRLGLNLCTSIPYPMLCNTPNNDAEQLWSFMHKLLSKAISLKASMSFCSSVKI